MFILCNATGKIIRGFRVIPADILAKNSFQEMVSNTVGLIKKSFKNSYLLTMRQHKNVILISQTSAWRDKQQGHISLIIRRYKNR